MTDLLPTCATGTHAPAPTSEHATVSCCAVRDGIASIDFQLRIIVALAPSLDSEQLDACRATYRAAVARRKELVAADPHGVVRHYRKPSTGQRGYVDCACGVTLEGGSLQLATHAHVSHVAKAAADALHSTPCVCGTYDRCPGVREQDARDAARYGATAAFRAQHRAYND